MRKSRKSEVRNEERNGSSGNDGSDFIIGNSAPGAVAGGQTEDGQRQEGKTESVAKIYEQNDLIYGKLIELLKREDKGKVCSECSVAVRTRIRLTHRISFPILEAVKS